MRSNKDLAEAFITLLIVIRNLQEMNKCFHNFINMFLDDKNAEINSITNGNYKLIKNSSQNFIQNFRNYTESSFKR